MKKILFILLAITGCMFTSCENQDWEFPDYEYTSVYFAYQTPIRTITFGEDVFDTSLDNQGQCQIMATMGGVYSNDANRTISITVDNSIVDDITFADGSEIVAMPSSYYSLSADKIVIPAGKLLGGVTVQLTDAFFADPEAMTGKYVIPVRMTGVQGADTILSGTPLVDNPRLAVASDWDVLPKNYILYAIKYINQYDSWYLRTGTDAYTDARGTVERKWDYIEDAEQVKTFSTLSKSELLWDFDLKDAKGYARDCKLKLDFTESGAVSISSLSEGVTASGSGQYTVLGENNSWGGKDRDVMTLSYNLEWPEFIEVVENGPLTHWSNSGTSSIKYVEEVLSEAYHMEISNETLSSDGESWKAQVWVTLPEALEKGKNYTFTCKAKATSAYSAGVFLQSTIDSSKQQYGATSIPFGEEMTEISATFSPNDEVYNKFTINIGSFKGTIEIDDVAITLEESEENLIPNGTFDDYIIWKPEGSVQVTDKLVFLGRGVKSEWFEVAAK